MQLQVDKYLTDNDIEYFDDLTNNGHVGVHEIVGFHYGHPFKPYFAKDIKQLVSKYVKINKNDIKENDYNAMHKTGVNYFLTPNTLAHHHRVSDNVIGLKACWVDIDTEKVGISFERFIRLLPYIVGDMKQPPNSVIYSGHGFYFMFKFDKEIIVHNRHSMISLWNKLEKTIVNDTDKVINETFPFEQNACDKSATDVVRLLRVPGTYNYKYQRPVRKCKTIMNDLDSYTFFTLCDKYLPPYNPNYSKHFRIKHQITIKHKYGLYTLKKHRDDDLQKLIKLRHYHLKNCRNNFMFVVAVNACYYKTNNEVMDELDTLNDSLDNPLPKSEIEYLKARVKFFNLPTEYKLNNEWIIDELNIQDNEQKQLKTIITKTEKYRRKNELRNRTRKVNGRKYDTTRRHVKSSRKKRKKTFRNRKIIQLHDKGYPSTQIVKLLNVSRPTVTKVLKARK